MNCTKCGGIVNIYVEQHINRWMVYECTKCLHYEVERLTNEDNELYYDVA